MSQKTFCFGSFLPFASHLVEELVDIRKLNVALKWLRLWVNIMVMCFLLSDFDFDQIPSREQRAAQNLQYSDMQFSC